MRGNREHVDGAINAAWCRGAANILFEIEAAHPPGHFGSAGLGMVAAQLLDHAYCIEHHSSTRPATTVPDDGRRP